MRYREFGRTGWQVGEVGYGMWGMGGWAGSDDAESLASLHRAVEHGCTFFDTAWAYGRGHSERLLGEVVRAHPDRPLVTASKIPPKNMQWPGKAEAAVADTYPPDHIREYTDASLRHLGLERVDLMQFHVWDDAWAGDGQVQVVVNIFDQAPEDRLFPACRARNVAVIARVPFDEGTLTGTLTRHSRWPDTDWRSSYFTPAHLDASVSRAKQLAPLVPPGASMSDLARRFILTSPDVSTVIPGMRKARHVEANLGASDRGPLAPDLMSALRAHRWNRAPDQTP